MEPLDRQLMNRLLSGESLDRESIRKVFQRLVHGELEPIQTAGIIAALKARGETTEELVGAAEALLQSAVEFPGAPVTAIDIVGTGGDGLNTLNISTLAAITAAVMGVPVAKHGNRSVTSLSGSFDLLQRLGIDIHSSPSKSAVQLKENGICFLFAPDYHIGLKHAGEVRRRLNARTVFNLLGPLVNPARPKSMLLGVALPELQRPMAEALCQLGCQSAAVIHGGGLDEIAVHSQSSVTFLDEGSIREVVLEPKDFGQSFHPLEALTVQSVEESHDRAERILAGGGTEAENAAVAVNAAIAARVFRGQGELAEWAATAIRVLQAGEGLRLVRRLGEIA